MNLTGTQLKDLKILEHVIDSKTINDVFKNVDISEEGLSSTGLSTERLYIKEVNIGDFVKFADYTAFEVTVLSDNIEAGDINPTTGIEYKEPVSTSMVAGVQVKTYVDQKDSDVIIDWGDGTVVKVSSATSEDGLVGYEPAGSDPSDRKVQLRHTYSEEGTYIVKIFGQMYHMLRPYCSGSGKNCTRIFDYDLPIASCVTDMNSAFEGNLMLQRINVPRYFNWKNLRNISSIFHGCHNLISAKINKNNSYFGHSFGNVIQVFWDCKNMTECTWRLPSKIDWDTGYYEFYKDCKSLQANLIDLLPVTGFTSIGTSNSSLLNSVFLNCISLKGRALDHDYMLWNNPLLSKNDGGDTFKGCSSDLLLGVPKRWGGSVSYNAFYGSKMKVHSKVGGIIKVLIVKRLKFMPAIIDWGDGSQYIVNPEADEHAEMYVEHTYPTEGDYIVTITDNTSRLQVTTLDLGKFQVLEVLRIGDHVTTMQDSFLGYSDLTKVCAWGYSVHTCIRTYKNCANISDVSELENDPTPSRITTHTEVVTGCSDAMKSLFPTSWGGTK